ncbi:MIP/aquaporin family protein [Fimbriimonas ginsengisoli]|uniref:Aquaporin Z n=1 Tax=Fimbriimonas ginsengisoli Gsoil 348 TaxID=661478 RepID=A0A068NSF7_FIMGI|nr:aquaporin [Fimbriimonas ginsengisoli]AIE86287.1 Aquaporin Z [Fimbriimonas ginsengisoli Gsoil 348]
MWRRYVAEGLGTFAIVFFGCGAIASLAGQPAAHLMVNAVFGLVVAASIYALGHISAAHFNPAVTVAFAVAKRFPWRYVPTYVASQLAGALAASGLHAVLFGGLAKAVGFGATQPTVDLARCLGIEATLTFFLMLVIISVATDRRANGAVPGLAIGMAVALCGLFGGPLTGCSMNPARSLAPALFAGGPALAAYWPYLVGPVIGACLAALVYEAIRGGDEHGQGAPNDLELALEKVRQEGIH